MRTLLCVCLLCLSCGVDSQLDVYPEGRPAAAGVPDETGETSQAITARTCPSGPTVSGVDVSIYQGGSIDWNAVKASGRVFGISRISDGLGYFDGTFAGNWERMKAAGLIRGAYQYFEPAQDPVAQANMVVAHVGRLGPGDLPVMLDVEATGGQSPATITAHIHQWIDVVTRGTGKTPMIYTGAYFWDASVQSGDFAGLPLVIAWYGTTCPGMPNAWSGHHWAFHQFSSSEHVPGIPGNVDADVFDGTLAQLQAFAGGSGAPQVGLDLCTDDQRNACAAYGCGCLLGGCSGGYCAVTSIDPKYRTLTGDFDGDGKTDVATLSALGGGGWADWASVDLSTGSGLAERTWSAATPQHMRNGGALSTYRVLTGDFNGDGKTDLATLSPNGGGGWADWVALELSTGNGFVSTTWPAATPRHMRNGDGTRDYKVVTGDFNGDGRTDLATISRNGGGGWADWVALELSTGNGFVSTVWGAVTPGHMRRGNAGHEYKVLTGDFNGDGLTDLATLSPNGEGGWADWVALELSTGSGFTSVSWTAHTPAHMRNGGPTADYRVFTGDFNGDGKTDLATITPNGGGGWAEWVALELSTGSGFTSTTWRALSTTHLRNGGAASYQIVAGDFDGNGKTDLATISSNAAGGWADWVALELSSGSGFSSSVWWTPTPQHMRNGDGNQDYRVLTGHFDGDGKTDLLTLSPSGGGGWADWAAVDLSTGLGFASTVWSTPTPQHIRNGG